VGTLRAVTRFSGLFVVAVVAIPMTLAGSTPAAADVQHCRVGIVKQLVRFKKTYLRLHRVCIEKENLGKIPGPCPDPKTNLKVQTLNTKVVAKIADLCTMADIMTLGYRSDCAYETATMGIEGSCAALPVTTPSEFAECLKCWKAAELSEFIALLFPSHALEECGGSLDETSPRCSDLDCTTPLPVQHNLGDTGENDCQKGIGRQGVKYLVNREKVLEKCLLAGGDQTSCLADLKVQEKLAKVEAAKQVGIQRKCGQRSPNPNPPFCCRTGMANACTVVATREDCLMISGATVKEGQTCNAMTLNCDPVTGGNQEITWWSNCPESDTCPGPALSTRDDLVACVDSSADSIVDELLCLQFPLAWSCPADVP
jgi:hypothetical protein